MIDMYFFLHSDGDHHVLHSFPTRRSSDLTANPAGKVAFALWIDPATGNISMVQYASLTQDTANNTPDDRSEEHTSELQSRPQIVSHLLLEKKNTSTGIGDHIVVSYDGPSA